MNELCFAYRCENMNSSGFEWKREYCDCLDEAICTEKHCRFFKNKDDVEMYVENKQVRHRDI